MLKDTLFCLNVQICCIKRVWFCSHNHCCHYDENYNRKYNLLHTICQKRLKALLLNYLTIEQHSAIAGCEEQFRQYDGGGTRGSSISCIGGITPVPADSMKISRLGDWPWRAGRRESFFRPRRAQNLLFLIFGSPHLVPFGYATLRVLAGYLVPQPLRSPRHPDDGLFLCPPVELRRLPY